MKQLKLLVLFLLCVMSYSTYAGTAVDGVTLKRVATGWGGEGIYISINESVAAVEGCVDSRYFMHPDDSMFKEVVSLLLSAFHSQTKVSFYVTSCHNNSKVHRISAAATYW